MLEGSSSDSFMATTILTRMVAIPLQQALGLSMIPFTQGLATAISIVALQKMVQLVESAAGQTKERNWWSVAKAPVHVMSTLANAKTQQPRCDAWFWR